MPLRCHYRLFSASWAKAARAKLDAMIADAHTPHVANPPLSA
jgi:hypothetical protein